MTTTLDASHLTLNDVYRLLKFEEHLNGAIASFLSLESLTDFEQQEILKLREIFRSCYTTGTISEGQIKFLFLSPLMWLSGFHHPRIKITLEEGIAAINVEDKDTLIKGRMDILAVSQVEAEVALTPLWILLIEAKNSSIEVLEGLPQLLVYAYKSLEYQEVVWGLTTNGMRYQFAYIKQGNPPTYQLLPELNLMDCDRSIQLLQVMKAIRKLYVV